MHRSTIASRGMITAPNHLAAQAGMRILREGGNAIEAMVAAAATIAVTYPHMNGIGGDGFWLIHIPGSPPFGIAAYGLTGADVHYKLFEDGVIPERGKLAATTGAATVAGWSKALGVSKGLGGTTPIDRLLEDAIYYAEHGFPIGVSLSNAFERKYEELSVIEEFKRTYYGEGRALKVGETLKQPALAETLKFLSKNGLEDFYQGEVAKRICDDFAHVGSFLKQEDLAAVEAQRVELLSVPLSCGTLYNLPPPTQGFATLLILALFDRMSVDVADSAAHVHGLVEATKRAFIIRNRELAAPEVMTYDVKNALSSDSVAKILKTIDSDRAMAWLADSLKGDTVWLGCTDASGISVSFIQSIYWEFGSGLQLPNTGILWQNRGSSFSLDRRSKNFIAPRKTPIHTLNPSIATLNDGRTMVCGTMGGDGQPQTQAAILSRCALFGQGAQRAVSAPRWLLGKTWGAETNSLKIESDMDEGVISALREKGHDVELVASRNEIVGQAGIIVRHANGSIEGASDPRSDGAALGF